MSVFNGKTNLVRLNPRYSGAGDLTQFLVNDEKYLKKIAKSLGITVLMSKWDIDYDQFNKVINDLSKILRENERAGRRTFVYF